MDIFDEILEEYFFNVECVNSMIEWRNLALTRFLNKYSKILDFSQIQNGILLIFALSSDFMHDDFLLCSKPLNNLLNPEKDKIKKILKLEICNGKIG
ncbi:MAG: hypothetical protein ACFFAO_12100 [Candidatus Hermodarchaeota archaeon]